MAKITTTTMTMMTMTMVVSLSTLAWADAWALEAMLEAAVKWHLDCWDRLLKNWP
jgi:hypothetical protein